MPPATQFGLFDPFAFGGTHRPYVGPQVATGPARSQLVVDRRRATSARLLDGLTLVGPYDIPKIENCDLVPDRLVAFSEAMSKSTKPDHAAWVHFYEDDYRYERLWRSPGTYLPRLASFAGIISPDFSIYRNTPVAEKIHQTYRNQLLGARMQADGGAVIANVRLSGKESIPYALAGVPRQSTIAIGLHGCTRDKVNRCHVVAEIALICAELDPTALVVYGSAAYAVLDQPRERGIPVHIYPADTFRRSQSRKLAA